MFKVLRDAPPFRFHLQANRTCVFDSIGNHHKFRMWGAIKSDLFSFVTTIQDDTTKTLNRVLGDNEEEVR